VEPGGRLHQSRQTVLDRVAASPWLSLVRPMGAMYAFIRLGDGVSGRFGDQQFALELLESKHVLVAPGSSFNTPYTDHFRITILPDPETLHVVFDRINEMLEHHAAA
jgi:alanine-synthesizing transaminase